MSSGNGSAYIFICGYLKRNVSINSWVLNALVMESYALVMKSSSDCRW